MTVQGPPRTGLRRFGVPPGGWFDSESARIANAIRGNPIDSPCLELTFAQVRVSFAVATEFAVTGAKCEVKIGDRTVGSRGRFSAPADALISISSPTEGVRAYFSTRFGTLLESGARVMVSDELPIVPTTGRSHALKIDEPDETGPPNLRVVAGPQAGLFDLSRLVGQSFTVSAKSNRVGIRLDEKPFPHSVELASEPAGYGAVQITPDGTPIVLGPDGPTIGGYPKIAYVISADFDRLGQLRPGQTISLDEVSLEEARGLAREHQARVEHRAAELSLATRWS